MELKQGRILKGITAPNSLNRTFYGIETFVIGRPHFSAPVLIVPFMELKPEVFSWSGSRAAVLIVPFMELKQE